MDRGIALWSLCFLISFVVMIVMGEVGLGLIVLLLLFTGLRLADHLYRDQNESNCCRSGYLADN